MPGKGGAEEASKAVSSLLSMAGITQMESAFGAIKRITDEHRLIYKVEKETIYIASCKYHYKNR